MQFGLFDHIDLAHDRPVGKFGELADEGVGRFVHGSKLGPADDCGRFGRPL